MALSLKELISPKVVTVTPDTSLVRAIDVLLKNDFSGLPVVNEKNVLVGILTDYDLILKGTSIHLPTFLQLLKEFEIYKKDNRLIKGNIQKILEMKVSQVMNPEPLVLTDSASIDDVIEAFRLHHRVNPIPIVDQDRKVIGIISRADLLKLYGAPQGISSKPDERQLDQEINKFLSDFEKKFILVSRTRTHYWLIFSLVFAIIGFIIAFAMILRIEF